MYKRESQYPFAYFFTITIILGWALPLISLFLLSRMWILPVRELSPENWHGHEFTFAFVFSFLVGHLLTVSSSWTKNKNPSLKLIFTLIALFFIDRFIPFFFRSWFSFILLTPFFVFIIKRVMSNSANFFFISVIAVVFLISKALFFIEGYELYAKNLMSGGIRFYIVLIISRMWSVYAKHSFSDIQFGTPKWLHQLTIGISLLLILPFTMQSHLYIRMSLLIVGILIYSMRFGLMKPHLTFRRPDTAIFLFSFGWIIYGLILELQVFFEHLIFYFISYNHALFMGGFALFAMGMMNRFLKGMTGESLPDKYLWLMIILIMSSLVFRILIPMYEGVYMAKVYLMVSALSWSASWGTVGKLSFLKFLRGMKA